MVRAVLSLFEQTGADGVLPFNSEEAVVRCVGGEVPFSADRQEWDELPEAAELTAGLRTASLPQPLL